MRTKLLAACLCIVMAFPAFFWRPSTAEAAVDYPDELYLTQSSNECTLTSTTMMMRARLYLSHNDQWNQLSQDQVGAVAWRGGLLNEFTYAGSDYSIHVKHRSYYGRGITLDEVKELLAYHPEGIVLHRETGNMHAVFITDCENDILYCADPAIGYSGRRIPLTASVMASPKGEPQDSILRNIVNCWYVDWYDINENWQPGLVFDFPQEMIEVAGDTRIDTAVAASNEAFNLADSVIIANKDSYADALAAASLAGLLQCPILLSDQGALPEATLHEIQRLGARQAYLIGGEGTLNAVVEQTLRNSLGAVTRLGGLTRYDTALAIYRQGLGQWSGDAILTTGEGYADALSIAAYAAKSRTPIMLTKPDQMPNDVRSTLLSDVAAEGQKIIIIGGAASVSIPIESDLCHLTSSAILRLAGQNRYGTAAQVAQFSASCGLRYRSVGLAIGSEFADALVAGPIMAQLNGVLLLVDPADISGGFPAVEQVRTSLIAQTERVYFFGGEAKLTLEARHHALTLMQP